MRPLRPFLLNTLSFWLWALALVSLGLFAATATQRLQTELQRREAARYEASTQQAMELWERQVLDATATWLASFESAGDLVGFEQQAREEIPWVDSFYLWDTRDGTIIHPRRAELVDDPSDLACLRAVERAAPMLPAHAEADAYLACLPAPPPMELLLTGRAATLLLQAGEPEPALRALHAGQTPQGLPLEIGQARGIPASRLARWRLGHVEVLAALGDLEQVREQALALGGEICALNGPDLDDLLDSVAPRLLELLEDQTTALEQAELTADLERTARRLNAWVEVDDRLSRRTDIPAENERPQLLRDPYTVPPYLLLFRRLNAPNLAAAVQVDEGVLVERLMQVVEEGYGASISVQDGSGRHLAGPPLAERPKTWLSFPLVFEYLRVSLVPGDAGSGLERNRLLVIQLLPIALTVLLGTLALLARAAAIRRQLELETRRAEFVTRVTHELKTPLAGIRVMAEVIEMGAYRNDDERAELAQRILNESERLARRVDEVLDMARAPSDFQFEEVDLADLCEEAVDRWQDLMDQNDITIEVELANLPPVMAQYALLRDAVSALLENAIKYRDPTRDSFVRLSLKASGRRWVVIEVVDNGIGVPADKRRMIFEPFARVEGPGRGESGGHGLGLSFVANAARVHNGRAECREGIEGGARFFLRLRR